VWAALGFTAMFPAPEISVKKPLLTKRDRTLRCDFRLVQGVWFAMEVHILEQIDAGFLADSCTLTRRIKNSNQIVLSTM
jgi:hypothetical protein